ncbi:uncharacterized protein LOC113350799 [Papaver somniferum]|uniref:uncharacterized protein LOC113350799 n=1 Tax=Papaver somniferum TaxID=3469 RepID=UPI000E6FDD0A|nr:uncharacterized protein LOC113350799 [Papaver somniferum]
MEHLTITLELLKEHSLFSKLRKCSFGQSQIDYLWHIISGDGVAADPEKIACIMKSPVPTTLRDLRGFLGLTGYYKKFVKGYGIICKPLTELLKKNKFQWSEAAQTTFQLLKEVVTTTHVLALPDFTTSFEVATDACDVGVGAALMQ